MVVGDGWVPERSVHNWVLESLPWVFFQKLIYTRLVHRNKKMVELEPGSGTNEVEPGHPSF
jgi:hypothetical protein